jgi:hypothetical protein
MYPIPVSILLFMVGRIFHKRDHVIHSFRPVIHTRTLTTNASTAVLGKNSPFYPHATVVYPQIGRTYPQNIVLNNSNQACFPHVIRCLSPLFVSLSTQRQGYLMLLCLFSPQTGTVISTVLCKLSTGRRLLSTACSPVLQSFSNFIHFLGEFIHRKGMFSTSYSCFEFGFL